MQPRLGLLRPVIAHPRQTSTIPRTQYANHARCSSTSPKDSQPATASLNPRWLSELRTRIGKCIMFGLTTEQTKEAGGILQQIALDWRELLAGSEGFLTDRDRRGLYRQEVVWGEMDSMGHVNNVMYNRYAESARVNWVFKFANIHDPAHKADWTQLLTSQGIGLILRSIRTDYKFPMKYPDNVTVLHKLRTEPKAGTDHFILDVLILSELHRRPAARCIEDIVVYDYEQALKAPLKPFMVDEFRKTWELQEAVKKTNGERVTDLIYRVERLEKDSWDRSDAKEDFGSARSTS